MKRHCLSTPQAHTDRSPFCERALLRSELNRGTGGAWLCLQSAALSLFMLLPKQRAVHAVQDALFAKVAVMVPGIRDAESDDDFDLAKMMERHRQQSEKIRREAVQMRQGQPQKCVPPPPTSNPHI